MGMYTDKEKDVLNSLYEGKITFYEAAKMLNVSEETLDEMAESYSWIPSSSRIAELCANERETLNKVNRQEKCQKS